MYHGTAAVREVAKATAALELEPKGDAGLAVEDMRFPKGRMCR
jgi:hypothetical protein